MIAFGSSSYAVVKIKLNHTGGSTWWEGRLGQGLCYPSNVDVHVLPTKNVSSTVLHTTSDDALGGGVKNSSVFPLMDL